MSVPATAAAQALGYSLQFTRLTVMLLEAPEGAICSLEVLDDVAVQTPDAATHLVQSKSSLGDNPVSDRALSLWKTLHNWLKLVEQEHVAPEKTRFELYVSRQVSGEIVESFDRADTIEKAEAALAAARKKLWGKPPRYSLRNSLPETLAPHVKPVLEAQDDLILPLLVNLRLKCGSGSPQADLETLLRSHPISPDKVKDVADKLCGWVKRKVDLQLEKALPALIDRDEFHREYVAYLRSADRSSILTSFAPKPTLAEQRAEMSRDFVRQLELIDLDFDDKLEAISDYLRACWDRTHWSQTGDVHECSFTDLDEGLQRLWRNVRKQKLIEHAAKTETEQGQLVYTGCVQHRTLVQGMTPPDHFVPGCFHRLADALNIGWHPDYRNALAKQVTSIKT